MSHFSFCTLAGSASQLLHISSHTRLQPYLLDMYGSALAIPLQAMPPVITASQPHLLDVSGPTSANPPRMMTQARLGSVSKQHISPKMRRQTNTRGRRRNWPRQRTHGDFRQIL